MRAAPTCITSGPAIRLESIGHSFGDKRALEALSFQVAPGTIFGFLGPNGAGKTTTISILLGLFEPTRGRAEVLGFDSRTHAHEIRARSGAILEHHGLYEQMTAEENLEFFARTGGMGRADLSARARELLGPAGLWDRRGDRVGSWSRGMKQQLALARALLHRPQVVFLDEPTAGLDVAAATAIRSDLKAMVTESDATVFLTTHNMAEAELLCGEIAVIREGEILAVGPPDELKKTGPGIQVRGAGFSEDLLSTLRSHPGVVSVEATDGGLQIELVESRRASEIVQAMVLGGADVLDVRQLELSLEEAFLSLVGEDS